MKGFSKKSCPRCYYPLMKRWKELSEEEKILAERLPMSATFTRRERETHLLCPRCWHEEAEETTADC